jgi:Family of unknown function (DUF5367)
MTTTAHSFNTRFWLGYGFSIWFIATLAIRFFGQWFFLPKSLVAVIILFVVSIPVMWGMMQVAYRMSGVKASERLLGATYVIVPGLLLDGLIYAFPNTLMPNLSSASAGLVAAWLLWCYGWVLITALFNHAK